ncbi:hypothetical protein [Clostridium sp. Marseille-P299]|uniref:hypothetical protein n=1 Tax=Clostridium sp. Marseille-P299 TaxID=1805477 RepID=UPI000829CA1C|nr:hypothetical protein [Clostridium sp. Marseille-P299]
MDFKEKIIELRHNGLSWNEIANSLADEYPELTYQQRYDKARNAWRSGKRGKSDIETDKTERVQRKGFECKADGSRIFEDILTIMEHEEDINPEEIIEAHKLDPKHWDVLSYKTNFWQAQEKGGKKMLLYQSKLTVKPKEKPEITLDDIDRYFENKDYSKDKLPIECLNYDPNGEILEIDLADPHIGLLSWRKETGDDYDLKIVKQKFFMCINDIVERCKYKKLKKVVLVGLGDVLHVDNNNQTTTNGTFQQTDGRLEKITECAEDMLIDGITILGKLAPVEFVHLCGNHDRLTGYMLARSVRNAFKNDKNVTFDIAPDPIKHKVFGVALVVLHHGDLPKKNTSDLPINFARHAISDTKFTEVHCGHYHTEETKVVGGVRVRYLPTIAASSYWEHQQGYKSDKAIVCYLWNEKTGLRDTWYTMI